MGVARVVFRRLTPRLKGIREWSERPHLSILPGRSNSIRPQPQIGTGLTFKSLWKIGGLQRCDLHDRISRPGSRSNVASDDVIPGEMSKVPCPHCGGSVFFMTGGPHRLSCKICKATFSLDVVHDGNRWTLRRV